MQWLTLNDLPVGLAGVCTTNSLRSISLLALSSLVTYPFTARVVGAPQMISQPVSSSLFYASTKNLHDLSADRLLYALSSPTVCSSARSLQWLTLNDLPVGLAGARNTNSLRSISLLALCSDSLLTSCLSALALM